MPRFIILEHTGAPDDPAGRHYDLLLEDGEPIALFGATDGYLRDGKISSNVHLPLRRP